MMKPITSSSMLMIMTTLIIIITVIMNSNAHHHQSSSTSMFVLANTTAATTATTVASNTTAPVTTVESTTTVTAPSTTTETPAPPPPMTNTTTTEPNTTANVTSSTTGAMTTSTEMMSTNATTNATSDNNSTTADPRPTTEASTTTTLLSPENTTEGAPTTSTTAPMFTATAYEIYIKLNADTTRTAFIAGLATKLNIPVSNIELVASETQPGGWNIILKPVNNTEAERVMIGQATDELVKLDNAEFMLLGAASAGTQYPSTTASGGGPAAPAPEEGLPMVIGIIGYVLAGVLVIVVIAVWRLKKGDGAAADAGNVGGSPRGGERGVLARHEQEMNRYSNDTSMMGGTPSANTMRSRPQFDKNNLDPTI